MQSVFRIPGLNVILESFLSQSKMNFSSLYLDILKKLKLKSDVLYYSFRGGQNNYLTL